MQGIRFNKLLNQQLLKIALNRYHSAVEWWLLSRVNTNLTEYRFILNAFTVGIRKSPCVGENQYINKVREGKKFSWVAEYYTLLQALVSALPSAACKSVFFCALPFLVQIFNRWNLFINYFIKILEMFFTAFDFLFFTF